MLNVRQLVGNVLRRFGLLKPIKFPPHRWCSVGEFDTILSQVGLEKLSGRTVGFGTVTYLPKAIRMIMHQKLQGLADRGVPCIRSGGTNYIVLARKIEI